MKVSVKPVKEITKVVVVSAFIPPNTDCIYSFICSMPLEKVGEVIEDYCGKAGKPLEIYTQHETIKLLGLEPAKERKTFQPTGAEIQIWLKPKKRLEFGKEYTLEELKEIGVVPYVAMPMKIL